MTERILCVDDDPDIMQAYQRGLRERFDIHMVSSGEEALRLVTDSGPFAVIVAELRMHGMDGGEVLSRIEELAPDSVRMILTGNADQQTALEAINRGHIFRFLSKPCPIELFAEALEAGINQYRLITAEKELLSKTLRGAIKVLTDLMSLVNPVAFGRAARIRRVAGQLARELEVNDVSQIELASMLSQIGCVAVPEAILEKAYKGQELSKDEEQAYAAYPAVGCELISHIPRLEEPAEIVAHQEQRFDGIGGPPNGPRGEEIPLGSRILKVAIDYDTLLTSGCDDELSLAVMHDREGWYDMQVVTALQRVLEIANVYLVRSIRVADLFDGLVLAEDILSIQGTVLCSKGQEVTRSMRIRLRNYVVNIGAQDQAKVLVPADSVKLKTAGSAT